jgi:acyl-CoA synthetase (AMP-forming)/AMP-acid ligase II
VKEQALSDVEYNLALTQEAVSAAVPDREYLTWRDRRFTYSQLTGRSRRLASYLHQRGLGVHVERDQLAGHESGQDHVALYMRNCNEFIEAMLGSFKSRTVPVNVNYRYVADELRYLFRDAQARAVIYHADFAPMLAQVRDVLPQDAVLIQVADDSGNALLPGAVDFEASLAEGSPEVPVTVRPDDLHIIYTGGTTGMPKAVLWRQHDIFLTAIGGQLPGSWEPVKSYDEIVQRALDTPPMRLMLLPPLMHGAAQWGAWTRRHARSRSSTACDTRSRAASRRRFGAAARAGFRHDQLRWRENNSGGEKIFAEEVEAAVTSHPSIADVIVTGRPSERWGQEVVALVQLVDCAQLDEAALARHAE